MIYRSNLLFLAFTSLAAVDVVDPATPRPRDLATAVTLNLTTSAAAPAVGDQVTVTVSWAWPTGWSVREPDVMADFAGEFVVEVPPAIRRTSGGLEYREQRLVLLARRSGAVNLPRPVLTATGPGGAVAVQAPAVLLTVGTGSATAALPAARPLVTGLSERAPLSPWWWLLALLLVPVGVVLWRLTHRRLQGPPPSPAEIAARELMAAARLTEGKALAGAAGLALRRFAGAVWGFDGPGMTAREAIAMVRGKAQVDEAAAYARMLEVIDGTRWAPDDMALAPLTAVVDEAKTWVERVTARLAAEAAVAKERP